MSRAVLCALPAIRARASDRIQSSISRTKPRNKADELERPVRGSIVQSSRIDLAIAESIAVLDFLNDVDFIVVSRATNAQAPCPNGA